MMYMHVRKNQMMPPWHLQWKFGRTRNAVGTRAIRQVFLQLFWVLPNFHCKCQGGIIWFLCTCMYISIETWKTCFLFLWELTWTKIKENNLNGYLDHKNVHCLSLVTLKQSAHIFSLSYFLNPGIKIKTNNNCWTVASNRTVKNSRDAYIKRLNGIYANNLKKVKWIW